MESSSATCTIHGAAGLRPNNDVSWEHSKMLMLPGVMAAPALI